MIEKQFHNLYNNPRLLCKYFPVSKEYAIKKGQGFIFCPNMSLDEIEEVEHDTIVEKWKAIALDGIIFFTSPAFFNDPFDTALPSVPEMVPSMEERKFVIEFLNAMHKISKLDRDRLLYSKDFDNALGIVLQNTRWPEGVQEIFWKDMMLGGKKYREQMAIACFSERNDSKLMWAHYANSYSGFCIEYDFSKCLDVAFRKGIGQVIYSDERPVEKDYEYLEDYAKAVCSTKALCWEYEKEWRAIQILPYSAYSNKRYPAYDVKNCITSIYLGCNMPEEYQLEIARNYAGTEVKVYRMVLSKEEFSFCFEEYKL